MNEYAKDNRSCPRCGNITCEIIGDITEITVRYLTMKRYAKIHTVFCPDCGLVFQEEPRDSSTPTKNEDKACGNCAELWVEDACLGTADGSACKNWNSNDSLHRTKTEEEK